jgi:hypothetical protein
MPPLGMAASGTGRHGGQSGKVEGCIMGQAEIEVDERWDEWETPNMSSTSELLIGLSVEELEALADGHLAPAAQARLDDLLARRKEQPLSAEDENELDRLLQKTDQLTILKTRARYTLSQAKAETTGT